jgi:glycosyltransferase involved in cell wall biosynthesis
LSRFGGPTAPAGTTVDVMFLLEGTYPLVSGGVSSWVHQILRGLPDITFGIVFIGGAPERYERLRYELPPNLVHLEEHFLAEAVAPRSVSARRPGDREFFECSARFHRALRGDRSQPLAATLEALVARLIADPARSAEDFLFSERAWGEICQRYDETSPEHSFLNYFWTIRSMHAPLFLLAQVAARVPEARSFHAASTGFAGFLAMLLRRARKRSLVLTEHGIYTKERRIELLQAQWIKDEETLGEGGGDLGVGFFRELWIRFFEALGAMTYDAADAILALYEGNRQRQIKDGADARRARIVPNGISVERFERLRALRVDEGPPIIGLIGRVVPIKDIKTFIRALRLVCTELPDAEGWIVGPEDEDPAYAEECRSLASNLGLEGRVRFLGFRDVEEIFPRMRLNLLTSISEAQPLVVLEGFAAGVPCVATDVGCCRELVLGASDEDRALGAAGAVVDIADPEATARASIALLHDRDRWKAAQRAGVARVERFYSEQMMLDRYRTIYEAALQG